MTKLDEAIGFLRSLPPERGKDAAAIFLKLTEPGDFDYTDEEMARLDISEAAAARVSLRRTNRCEPSGRSMVCEGYPLYRTCRAGIGVDL